MNEIEKLYENAGLSNMWVEEYDDKQIWHKSYNKMIESMMKINDWSRKVAVEVAKKECRKALPPFTAEKQVEIIKFLIGKHASFDMLKDYKQKDLYMVHYECKYFPKQYFLFEEALAESINYLWQDLTEEEKQQVKGILNG